MLAPKFPTMERDRTMMPRTTPNDLSTRYPGSSNVVVVNGCVRLIDQRLNTTTRADKSEKFRLPRSADSLSARLRREPRKRRQIPQAGEYKHSDEKRPQHHGRHNERNRSVLDFFHDQPCALRRQRRERQNEQRIVMQRAEIGRASC